MFTSVYKCYMIIVIIQTVSALQDGSQKGFRPFDCSRITYSISHYTQDLSNDLVDENIQKAFNIWADVSPLTFKRVWKRKADIVIDFEYFRSTHRLFKVLSTSMYKPHPKIVFNDFYCWTVGRNWGKNLLQVGVYEVGNLLGLRASENNSSAMYPLYQGYNPNFALSDEDIKAIQAIYGKGLDKEEKKTPLLVQTFTKDMLFD